MSTDVSNCGQCAKACPTLPFGSQVCAAGVCATLCANGRVDCNGVLADECEVDLSTNLQHCGGCGVSCAGPPNGTGTCQQGACVMQSCFPGFADCDGNFDNGCEANINTDVDHCGQCTIACTPPPRAQSARCVNAQCGVGLCAPGYGDCDNLPANGCESNLDNSAESCGACGVACPAYPQMQPDCARGACAPRCKGEFYDVDGNVANGCETQDHPTGNHSLLNALDVGGISACDGSLFTHQLIGYIPSDERPHDSLSPRKNNTVEDWYVVRPLGEDGCTNDLDFQVITSGGPEQVACFQVTFFTNQGAYPVRAMGTGMATLGNALMAYTASAPIYIKVEKTDFEGACASPVRENVLYIINYHL